MESQQSKERKDEGAASGHASESGRDPDAGATAAVAADEGELQTAPPQSWRPKRTAGSGSSTASLSLGPNPTARSKAGSSHGLPVVFLKQAVSRQLLVFGRAEPAFR